jgi:hypothetical protein
MAEIIEIRSFEELPKGRPLLLIRLGDGPGIGDLGRDVHSITLPANATDEEVRQTIQEVRETAESEGRTICVIRALKTPRDPA